MTRKITFIFLLFMAVSFGAQSQAIFVLIFGDKMKTDFMQSGINFSLSSSGLIGLPDSKLRIDWALGAFTEFELKGKWSVQPQLTVKMPAGAKTVPSSLDTTGLNSEAFKSEIATRVMSYIALPIFMKYNTRIFALGLGPQVGFMVSGKDNFDGETIQGVNLVLSKRIKDEVHKWDVGAAILFEFILRPDKRAKSMRLALQGYYGFLDVNKNPKLSKMTNYSILFNVSIPIGG